MNANEMILPLIIILTGIVIGTVLELVVYQKIKKLAVSTNNNLFKIIINSFRGLFIFCFSLTALYISINRMNLPIDILIITEQILTIALILVFTWWVARLLAGFVNLYTQDTEGVLPASSLFGNITRIIVFILGLLVIIQFLGISITPMLTAFGIGGIAVALALEDTLSNMFSGINVISSRELKIGDYIMLDSGEEGYVEDITWRNTTIKPLSNNKIIVPNNKMASSIITNYHKDQKELLLNVRVGVSYDSDLEMVERITLEVAREVLHDLKFADGNFEPYLRFSDFDNSSIKFNVFLSAKEFVEQYPLKHEFIKRLHKRYQKEGIEIPFPIRTVHMKK
ncbi:mechanosensitive ion channel family protein [Methanobacterium alkalithermotolerans]|uniref:Mechanosensitive ion channel family protein n=1 Tax=Methanobacterium alkalithermotolerans TaxID=2731220 RepID=A0A8T8KBI3_9EURY|nr:mechanosensitive ion channel family protein [Methanobacterium alkalithermotolerans]QUH24150.1 mechanosensitive ion channel family protein [Methanobacterium alkalithermotolerans]